MSLREMHEQQKQSSPREQLQELNRQSRTELENSLLKEALAMSSENCEELMKQSNQEQVRAEQNRQRDAEQNRKLISELKQSVELLKNSNELLQDAISGEIGSLKDEVKENTVQEVRKALQANIEAIQRATKLLLQSNRKFRVLNVIDDSDRVAVAQKVAHSIPASRLIRFMEEIIWEKGKPSNIRCDNGPEFISHKFQDWCDGNGIKILYTQPGCPTQNSYIERFNGSYRRAVLDAYIFRTLDDVREITEKWTDYYNNERPHDSLNNLAPMEYRLMRTG